MKALPELLIVRHGETEWNRLGRVQGQNNSPLTALGQQQARRVGEILRSPGVITPAHHAVVSPLGRAQETADIALSGLPLSRSTDDRLAEIDVGDAMRLTKAEAFERFPTLARLTGNMAWHFNCPGGESYDDFSGRIESWLSEVAKPTVVIAHGVVSRVMRSIILGLGLEGVDHLAGGQGVVHRIRDGRADMLE